MRCLEKETEESVEFFTNNLKQRKFDGSVQLVLNTVQLLRRIISQTKWTNARELMDIIRQEGKILMETAPSETVVGNMTRRILKIIRDEYGSTKKGKQDEADVQESLQKILLAEGGELDYAKIVPNLKSDIMDSIAELITEIETSEVDIAAQASEHIHSNETIMTIGHSKTVEAFLKNAAKSNYHLIVAECAPFYHGRKMAASLAECGIQVTLIADSSIFAMMAQVNKVIIGTHSVMANGGLKGVCGTYTMALAAKHYSVPLIVCAPMFKLCPQFVCSIDQDGFNQFASPVQVISSSEGQLISSAEIFNPVYDYVPPELVTLFISNSGGHAPSYIYRLLSEFYHPDVDL